MEILVIWVIIMVLIAVIGWLIFILAAAGQCDVTSRHPSDSP